MGRLSGKIALITGAGQGIGRASVNLFMKEGARVIATDLDISKLSDFEENPGILKIASLDVTNKSQIEELVKYVEKIDVLLNCAGYVPGGSVLDCSDEIWEKTMNLNARGAFWMCQAFIPIAIKNNDQLSIVNISSVASNLKGIPNRFAYSVSKGALNAINKSIAADFISQGIRSNNICPGTVDTPSFRDRVNQSEDPVKALDDFIQRQKMGRLGTAEEIANLALYLASDESAYVTGQDFIIDGGWSL